jgi:hypothetical protein
MAWEDLVKKQTDLFARLVGEGIVDWRNAKDRTAAGTFTADEAVRQTTKFWKNLLNFWWGPWDRGHPNIPVLLITAAPGASKAESDCRLLTDTVTANVTLTAVSRVGGTDAMGSATHTVTEGTKLKVTVTGVPTATGLYEGLALEGNEPIAFILAKVG